MEIQHFLETIARLEKNNDDTGLLHFLQQQPHNPDVMILALWQLCSARKLRLAYILAIILNNNGRQNAAIAMTLSVGGLIFNDQKNGMRGLELLRILARTMTPEYHAIFYVHVIAPLITDLLLYKNYISQSGLVLRVLEILKAADPRCQLLFDMDAPVPELSLEQLCQHGRTQARLLHYKLPPIGTNRQRRRVLVTGRETVFVTPNSLLVDIGPRYVAAMNTYGWHADFYAMKRMFSNNECHAIVDACRQKNPDILFLEENFLINAPARTEMITQIRQQNPSIKIVGYFFDSWLIDSATILKAATMLDCVSDPVTPSSPVWKNPAVINKMLCLPIPSPVDRTPDQPLLPEMLFNGSIKMYNWHRAFWMAAIERLQLPIKQQKTLHCDDGLPALESHALYMQRLAEATCCLNFTMRPDPGYTRIVPGRGFETILSGSLLVQEASPDMHYYFTPGEHYLEFTTIAELAAITRFITEKKEEAEEIRRCGNHFAREHYSDENIIGCFDKALFFPDQPTTPN